MAENRRNEEKLIDTIKESPKLRRRLTIRGVLSFFIVTILIRAIFVGRYENVFVCVLSLLLFCVPMMLEKKLSIDIPPLMEAIIYCFIFAAEILGEINSFYTKISGWDTMLHTLNGFLVAAVGFCLVDLFNRSERMTFKLSPIFLALVAFCFSMTVGVLWEFFEFSMDYFFGTDMQKDFIINTIHSVALNPDGLNNVVTEKITSLVVNGKDWMEFPGGYIDIGIIDTMKDLMVNFVGAVVFSVIGFFYVKNRGKGKFAPMLIPIVLDVPKNSKDKKNKD